MREFVYVSRRKIEQQFDLGRRRSLPTFKAAIKAQLGIGELSVETAGRHGGVHELDAVIAELEKGDRSPIWFTDGAEPGQWVHFEAPMSYARIGNAVVFLDTDEQSGSHPSDAESRLILHGSAEHLTGINATPQVLVDELSELGAARSIYDADALASVFSHFINLLEGEINEEENSTGSGFASFRNRISASGIGHILPVLRDYLRLPESAAWMAGYARVTAVTRRGQAGLFATPLYVEHVSRPIFDDVAT